MIGYNASKVDEEKRYPIFEGSNLTWASAARRSEAEASRLHAVLGGLFAIAFDFTHGNGFPLDKMLALWDLHSFQRATRRLPPHSIGLGLPSQFRIVAIR